MTLYDEPYVLYRPPFEMSSLLLPVTMGCSHNRCNFCTMYRQVPFRMIELDQVAQFLEQAKKRANRIHRVFLENGDPFVLPAERLMTIAEMIHNALPQVETIAMYASIQNIRTKTDDELRQLRALGINELNIGVESGLDETLALMNKGYNRAEAEYELLRLREAGMDFGANIIYGGGGPALRVENAIQTAELLNRTTPYLVFTGTLHADPGCPLYEQMARGEFVESTVGQYLEEMEIFLQHLRLERSQYYGLHPSNIVPMAGYLPSEQERLLAAVRQRRDQLGPARLAARPIHQEEGAVVV